MRRIVSTALSLAVLVLCAAATPALAKVIYVDDNAPASGDGTSWTTAYRFLQDALADAASTSGPVEVRVAEGTYKPNRSAANPEGAGGYRGDHFFRLDDGMSLLGGYAGVVVVNEDPNARDIEAYETILSGDLAGNDAEVIDAALLRTDATRDENACEVLRLYAGQVLLSGCTIIGGTAGGVTISGPVWGTVAGVIVSDCTFQANRGNEGDAQVSAGALTSLCKDVLIARCSFVCNAGEKGAVRAEANILQACRFERNYSWGIGRGAGWLRNCALIDCLFVENRPGALAVGGGHSELVGCVFRENSMGIGGGAISCEGHLDMQDCLFVGNEATVRGGGGVHLDGHARLVNCVFAGNRAREQGAAWASGRQSSLEMVNCTILQNRAPKGGSLSIDLMGMEPSGAFSVRNCVLSNGDDEISSEDVRAEVSYTCLGQGIAALTDENDGLVLGLGNVVADPCFVDPGYWDANGTPDDPNDDFFVEGDYHLKSQAGRWDLASGGWVQDDVTSPCIDAGDPNSPIMYELFPNGGVVNMGAYGGTVQASKSYFGAALCETIIAGDINGDCRVDIADVVILLDHWLEDRRSATSSDED